MNPEPRPVTPGRDSMVPEGSGQPMRPGVDCPNCGSELETVQGARRCTNCSHRERWTV